MATNNYGWAALTGVDPADVPHDVNALANEVDATLRGVDAVAASGRASAMQALSENQTQDEELVSHKTAISALNVAAGYVPGNPTDAAMTGIAEDPASLFATQLTATIDGSILQSIAVPNMSSADLYAYGSSYVLGTSDIDPYYSWVNRVGRAARWASITNHGVSGSTIAENIHDALNTTSRKWAVGTPGVVAVDAVVNCVQLWGDDAKGYQCFKHAARTFTALARAREFVNHDHASITYTGAAWATSSDLTLKFAISSFADSAEWSVDGDECTIIMAGKDSAAGGSPGGIVDVYVDGALKQTVNLNDASKTTAAVVNFPVAVRLVGMGVGTHTVKMMRNTASGTSTSIWLRGYLLPSADPAAVVLVKDAPRSTAGWASSAAPNANNTTLTLYNNILDEVADEFGRDRVAVTDAGYGFDTATMLTSTDAKHPNETGMAVYAGNVSLALIALGASAAWNKALMRA